jgi:hypothetical protein
MNRRSFVLRGSAAAAGAWLGLPSLGVAAEDPDVDLLVAMDDTAVRKKVGEVFMQCLRAALRNPFFPAAPDPEYKPTAPNTNLPDELAPMLVAWSLAHVPAFGFSGMVNEASVKGAVQRYLGAGGAEPSDGVKAFSLDVYKHFFPALALIATCPTCKTKEVTFGSLQHKANIGPRYCSVVASDSFYVKTMARRAADPKGFDQYVHLLLYMADVLAPGTQGQAVYKRWDQMAGVPWTVWEQILAIQLTEQTFLPDVQAACNRKEELSRQPGRTCVWHGICAPYGTDVFYGYGASVENWVNQQKKKYAGAFTDNTPNNKTTEHI